MDLQGASKNMPFNTIYPNSENIPPPVYPTKEAKRVIEPSTRASINMDVLKKYYEAKDRMTETINDERLQKYLDAAEYHPGDVVDIEV